MAGYLPPARKPETLLGYHRILSPIAGARVSPLCLGTMNFGNAWSRVMGECSKETSFEILDTFYNSGGNFIDTANFYQGEQSEQWLGEWMKERGNRDELVIATKFTWGYRIPFFGATEKIRSNFQGNHSKSLKLSLEASLKKLGTDYVDVLYVHMWDFTTSVEELMQSLNDVVRSGKVLYLGISDTPAWLVTKCNEYARHHNLTRFSIYQGHWSCAFRDFERDIIPMCESEGLAIAPWGALGRGMFRSREEFEAEGRKMGAQDEKHIKVGETLKKIAERKGTVPTSIALAYVMHKAPYVFPIVGGRKVEHLKANIDALAIELSEEEVDEIDGADEFDVGFPMNFLFEGPGQKYKTNMTTRDMWQVTCNTRLETVNKVKPIEPRQGYKLMDANPQKGEWKH